RLSRPGTLSAEAGGADAIDTKGCAIEKELRLEFLPYLLRDAVVISGRDSSCDGSNCDCPNSEVSHPAQDGTSIGSPREYPASCLWSGSAHRRLLRHRLALQSLLLCR